MITATARLFKDAKRLFADPVPYVTAVPSCSNILEWHYVIEGPPNTPYDGGFYYGKLVFPSEYPFKPPSIYILTPNGRFHTNTRLCLSISDFHPDTWNPGWSVGTILTGLLSFMLESTPTYGAVDTTYLEKRRLAYASLDYNLMSKSFRKHFPEVVKKIERIVQEREEVHKCDCPEEKEEVRKNATRLTANSQNGFATLSTFCILIGTIVFMFIARYILQSAP